MRRKISERADTLPNSRSADADDALQCASRLRSQRLLPMHASPFRVLAALPHAQAAGRLGLPPSRIARSGSARKKSLDPAYKSVACVTGPVD